MKTGICTTDFNKYKYDCDTLFEKIHQLGFECLQFAFVSITESDFEANGQIEIPPYIAPSIIETIMRSSASYDLPIYVINGTFNMAHPDAAIREEGLRRLEILAAAAHEMKVPYISLCSGTGNCENLWGPSDDNITEDAWNRMLDTMQKAVAIAAKHGIILAIEAEPANVISTPETARRVMDEIGSPNLKMILDCANLFQHEAAYRENVHATIAHAMEAYGKDVVIAHGKDIYDTRDGGDFCGTGLGIIDFAFMNEQLNKYNYQGHMFLHGIYDEADMPRARQHWLDACKEVFG